MNLKIRTKKLAKGYCSVFFDIHTGSNRISEFPGIKFKAQPSTPAERQERKDGLKLAEMLAAQRKIDLLQGKHNLEAEYKTEEDFITYAKDFIENHPIKETRKYLFALKKLTAFAGKEKIPCFEINESFLRRWVQYLEKKLNGETSANYYAKIKQIITSAVKERYFRTNPTIGIVVRKKQFLHKAVLSYDEIQILADTPLNNDVVKRAFLFSCFTGLRHCDIKVLCWSSIQLQKLQITQAKTKVPLTIPLGKDAESLLGERGKSEELVFHLPSHAGCQKWLKIWAKNAGLNKTLTWHSGRHTFGTNLIAHGVDVAIASKLLGHTSLVHTQRYVRINDDLKAQAIAKLPLLAHNQS